MKNMKKLLSLLLALVFVVGCLAGCGGTTSGGSSGEPAGDVKELAEVYEGRHWALVYGDHSKEIVLANTLLGIESTVLK